MYFNHTSPAMDLSSKSFSVGPTFDPFLLLSVTYMHLLLIYNPSLTICEETLNVNRMKE